MPTPGDKLPESSAGGAFQFTPVHIRQPGDEPPKREKGVPEEHWSQQQGQVKFQPHK